MGRERNSNRVWPMILRVVVLYEVKHNLLKQTEQLTNDLVKFNSADSDGIQGTIKTRYNLAAPILTSLSLLKLVHLVDF